MQPIVIIAGFLAQIVAFRVVAAGRATVWTLMIPVMALMGIVAAIARPPVASGTQTVVTAVLVGALVGIGLYAATIAFVAIAARWDPFRSHLLDRYRVAAEVSPALALGLSLLVAVPGEELFWRGLAQPRLQASLPVLSGPALAWFGYVIANLASGSLPFIAGALVGGIVWGGLALWTHGVLASVLAHAAWTAGMLLRPPSAARAAGAAP